MLLLKQQCCSDEWLTLHSTMLSDGGNVLLASAYALGYAACDNRSLVQCLWRAFAAALAVTLYVAEAFGGSPLLVLAVAVVTELCDNHRDALSLVVKLIGCVALGSANKDQGGWAVIVAVVALALVLQCDAPMPSMNAVALVITLLVSPFAPTPEAAMRVLGLCWLMYAHRQHMPPLACHTVAYVVVAPWPVALIVALAQLALLAFNMRQKKLGAAPVVLV